MTTSRRPWLSGDLDMIAAKTVALDKGQGNGFLMSEKVVVQILVGYVVLFVRIFFRFFVKKSS